MAMYATPPTPPVVTADQARRLWEDREPIRDAHGNMLIAPTWVEHTYYAEDAGRAGRWQNLADAVNSWLTLPR